MKKKGLRLLAWLLVFIMSMNLNSIATLANETASKQVNVIFNGNGRDVYFEYTDMMGTSSMGPGPSCGTMFPVGESLGLTRLECTPFDDNDELQGWKLYAEMPAADPAMGNIESEINPGVVYSTEEVMAYVPDGMYDRVVFKAVGTGDSTTGSGGTTTPNEPEDDGLMDIIIRGNGGTVSISGYNYALADFAFRLEDGKSLRQGGLILQDPIYWNPERAFVGWKICTWDSASQQYVQIPATGIYTTAALLDIPLQDQYALIAQWDGSDDAYVANVAINACGGTFTIGKSQWDSATQTNQYVESVYSKYEKAFRKTNDGIAAQMNSLYGETFVSENPYRMDNPAVTFGGWLEYEQIQTENGIRLQLVSETLFSTNEMLTKQIPEYSVLYLAKWSDMDMEYYRNLGELPPEGGTTPEKEYVSIDIQINGGTLMVNGMSYSTPYYGQVVKEETLRDSGIIFGDPVFVNASATFAGWIICTYEEMTDDNGYSYWDYVQVPNTGIFNTETLLDYPMSDNYYIMAQWTPVSDPMPTEWVNVRLDLNKGSLWIGEKLYDKVYGTSLNKGTSFVDAEITFTTPTYWTTDRSFMGWMICTEELVPNQYGGTEWGYVQVPGTELLTTAELLAYPMNEEYTFVAQWSGNDDDYYTNVMIDGAGQEIMFGYYQYDMDGNKVLYNNPCYSDKFEFRKSLVGIADQFVNYMDKEYVSDPEKEGATLEGWIEYRYSESEYQINYTLVSDITQPLLTTEQMLTRPIPDEDTCYMAKWSDRSWREYPCMEPCFENGYVDVIFNASGGNVSFNFMSGIGTSSYNGPNCGDYVLPGSKVGDFFKNLQVMSYDQTQVFKGWELYGAEPVYDEYGSWSTPNPTLLRETPYTTEEALAYVVTDAYSVYIFKAIWETPERVDVTLELNGGDIFVNGTLYSQPPYCTSIIKGNTFANSNVSFANPNYWTQNRAFVGWKVCTKQQVPTQGGGTIWDNVQVPNTGIISTNDLLNYTLDKDYVFVAQWAGNDEDYYANVIIDGKDQDIIFGYRYWDPENQEYVVVESPQKFANLELRKTGDGIRLQLENLKQQTYVRDPQKQGATLEGWIEYKYIIDQNGATIFTLVSDITQPLLTTEQMLTRPIPQYNVCYMAKWSDLNWDQYPSFGNNAGGGNGSGGGNNQKPGPGPITNITNYEVGKTGVIFQTNIGIVTYDINRNGQTGSNSGSSCGDFVSPTGTIGNYFSNIDITNRNTTATFLGWSIYGANATYDQSTDTWNTDSPILLSYVAIPTNDVLSFALPADYNTIIVFAEWNYTGNSGGGNIPAPGPGPEATTGGTYFEKGEADVVFHSNGGNVEFDFTEPPKQTTHYNGPNCGDFIVPNSVVGNFFTNLQVTNADQTLTFQGWRLYGSDVYFTTDPVSGKEIWYTERPELLEEGRLFSSAEALAYTVTKANYQYIFYAVWSGGPGSGSGSGTQGANVSIVPNDGILIVDGQRWKEFNTMVPLNGTLEDIEFSIDEIVFWAEDREFAGWKVYIWQTVPNNKGDFDYEQVEVPNQPLLSTEELLEFEIDANYTFVAQWAGEDDPYYTDVIIDGAGEDLTFSFYQWDNDAEEFVWKNENYSAFENTYRHCGDGILWQLQNLQDAKYVGGPLKENATLEGWIEYKLERDPSGETVGNLVLMSERLLTTEEMFNRPIPSYDVVYMAKWSDRGYDQYPEFKSNVDVISQYGHLVFADGSTAGSFGNKFTIGSTLRNEGMSFTGPVYGDRDKVFIGWKVCEWKDVNGVRQPVQIPGTSLLTTDQILDYTLPETGIVFVAEWLGNNSGWGSMFMFASGGDFTWRHNDNGTIIQERMGMEVYQVLPNKTFKETMEEYKDGYVAVDKQCHVLTGWTVYTADTVEYYDLPAGQDPIIGDPDMQLIFMATIMDEDGKEYDRWIMLNYPTKLGEILTTEEVLALPGNKEYYVVANWKSAHDMTHTPAKDATCTTAGNKEYYTCGECNKVFIDEVGSVVITASDYVIPALGHDMTKTPAKDATCTTAGNKEYHTCENCEKVFVDAEGKNETTVKDSTIAALGHKMTKTSAKDVTCTTAGNEEYHTCDTCKKVFVDAEGKTETTVEDSTIAAPGHNYVTGTCTVCDHKVKVEDTIIEAEKVEDVDTTKPVEVVTPVVKQEAVESTTKDVSKVVENILSDDISEETKEAVSEETIKEIKKEIELGNSITTEIVVNKVEEDQVEEAVVEEIKTVLEETQKVAQYLDLSVMIQSVTEDGEKKDLGTLNVLSEKISFTIVIPADLEKDGREFFVIRVHDGVAEKLEVSKNEDGSYSFETDRFSTYALAYEDVAEIPKTGDNTPIMLFALMLLFGAAMIVGAVYRSKKYLIK